MYSIYRKLVSRVLTTSAFVMVIALLLIGQLFAQDTRAEAAEFVCLRSQVNPANNTNDYNPVATTEYVVWEALQGLDTEIFAQNRSTGVVTQITDNDFNDHNPQIDGNYVVWRFDNPNNDTREIALHNLNTGMTQVINENTFDDLNPQIDGNDIAWFSTNPGPGTGSSVKHYDIAAGVSQNVEFTVGSNEYYTFDVSDGRILYRYIDSNDNNYLYVYNIATDTTTLVSGGLPDTDAKYNAAIEGDIVVWENLPAELSSNALEIYAYNLTTETLVRITDDDSVDIAPAVYGNYVVYINRMGTGSEMHLYDLQTGIDRLIASEPSEFYYPVINDVIVAWQSEIGIFVYDLMTSSLIQVTDYEEGDRLALVDRQVFWAGFAQAVSSKGGAGDIFMADCGFTPSIVQQPQSIEIAVGESTMLSVVVNSDAPLSYQWFEGDATDSSTPIAGATVATFITPPIMQDTTFWVRVSNQYRLLESDRAIVIVSGQTLTPESSATSTATPEITATPSLTPTPTLPGSVQILPNTSFELDVENDKIPDGWSAKGTQLKNADKLKRNKLNQDGSVKAVAYSGESAFLFKGNPSGEKSSIHYKLSDFAVITDGTTLEFNVYVNRFNLTPGETIGKVKISFSDGSKETLQLSAPDAQGYTSVSDSLVVDLDGRTIEKFKVEFSTNLTGGKFLIDNASLLVIPAALTTETDLLPLPMNP